MVDGDTLVIGNERIRLFGIDAPESNQDCGDGWPCGREATNAVEDLIGGKSVRCEGDTRDFYGRLIAVCYAGSVDIGGNFVRRGLALAYRTYSVAYVEHEDEARQHGRGMWSGAFVAPWDWRRVSPCQQKSLKLLMFHPKATCWLSTTTTAMDRYPAAKRVITALRRSRPSIRPTSS